MNRRFLFLILASSMFFATMLASFQVQQASANVPSIVSVRHYDVGSATWVNVTVNHGSPPAIGASHYVSNVQLEINGTVQDVPQSPQTADTFSVQYNVGSRTNTYLVRARALCNLHGYSVYSNLVSVPESITAVLLMMLLAAVSVVVAKKTLDKRTSIITLHS